MGNRQQLGSENTNASARDVSRANRMRIVECLSHGDSLSRVGIARITGMSPATVNRLTSSLMKSGLVESVGSDESTGGRPSMMVRFNPDSRLVLAVDINEDFLDVAQVNLDGQIRQQERISVSELNPDEKLLRLVATVKSRIAESHPECPFVAIGISVPGPVDSSGVVSLAPALSWYDVAVKERFVGTIDVPVTVENDVNLVAYGEYFGGNWGDLESLVAVGVYQGVGAGIVENGRLWRGVDGAAAQFGRMLRDVSGLHHERAGFGQVETRLGSTALLARAVQSGVVSPQETSPDSIFRLATQGNAGAVQFLSDVADEYALHLVNMCAIVAPEMIVFAGLFERWAGVMLPLLASRLEGNVVHQPILVPAALGRESKLIGAARFALEQRGGIASLV